MPSFQASPPGQTRSDVTYPCSRPLLVIDVRPLDRRAPAGPMAACASATRGRADVVSAGNVTLADLPAVPGGQPFRCEPVAPLPPLLTTASRPLSDGEC